jgi:hypothetical protein
VTLSDRLQQARVRRLIDAGVLPSDFAPEAEVEVPPEPVEDVSKGLFAPITIEVPPMGLHLVAEVREELTDLPEGEPASNCPSCHAIGHLDMVDLVGHTMHLTCETCGTMWQVRNPVNETAIG